MANPPPPESTAFGIWRSNITDIRPPHYYLKIDSFSFLVEMLENENAECYDSEIFEASGYKWKLSLYLNGARNISLFLSIEETSALPLGWEVNAQFKFFVFDHVRDNYLTVEADHARSRRFNEMKKRWGLPLLPIADFKDATRGYLVRDECVFGVEISVCNYSGKGEWLALPEKLSNSVYTWEITNYSALPDAYQTSPVFTVADHKWSIMLYPRGAEGSEAEGKSISVFLELNDDVDKVYAEYKLGIKNQINTTSHHSEEKISHLFSATTGMNWGYLDLLSLDDVEDASKGFLVKDTLIVEVEIIRISTVKTFT